MDNKLIQYFSRIMLLSKEEIEAIAETMTVLHYKKGRVLLKEGQISSEVYFVLEGCVRQSFLVDGEEKPNNFFTEEQWEISMNSFSLQIPSTHFMGCCIDTTLVVCNREREENMYKRFPNRESVSRKVMEKVFEEQQEIMASCTTDPPEQPYLKLFQSRPGLFQKNTPIPNRKLYWG